MGNSTILHAVRPSKDVFLTLGIAPGVIRFVKIIDLQNSNSVRLEKEVDALTNGIPGARLQFLDWGTVPLLTFAHQLGKSVVQDQYNVHDNFSASHFAHGIESLAEACSVFEAVVREFRIRPFPTVCYQMFTNFLSVRDFRLTEFRESWCPDALRDNAVLAYYSGHSSYYVCEHDATEINGNVVFKRTKFVDDRIRLRDRIARHELEIADQGILSQATSETFVYLMEDLRNKRIKIGRSSSPRKREKTLQSEVPEVHLRFAIPCEGTLEKKLHSEYAKKRIRGEWFDLNRTEILEIINKLRACGDPTRILADHNWIGELFVNERKASSWALQKRSLDGIVASIEEHLHNREDGKAIHELDQLILRAKPDALLYIARARFELRLGNFERALQDSNDAIRLKPKDASVLRLRAEIRSRLKDFDGAVSDYDRVVSLEPLNLKSLATRGCLKINAKDYVGAIRDLDNVVEGDSSLVIGFLYRAEANLRRGELNGATLDFNEAIRLDPQNVQALVGRGMTNHRCAKFLDSLLDYQKAFSAEPHYKRGRINKAFLLATATDQTVFDPLSGRELLTSVLESDPDDSYALNAMACVMASIDDFSSAIVLQKKALLNNSWSDDVDIDGGACASERIECWEAGSQWYPEVG